MATEGFKRKLAAIFSADVAGYSRLMGKDEEATVRTLEDYRAVMSALIKQHRGRVVDSPGDNLLAEFPSVVDAVQCAVAVQKELQTRNEGLPEERRMQFRIGINLGDVIEEQERLYGDGVNITARLEALADPGGICVSKTAFDHIESKLPLGYEYIGQQTVKNISRPVDAYKVMMEARVTEKDEKQVREPIPLSLPDQADSPLPDKPSIVVLPFTNMSNDPEQEYFSDGMTEDVITDLSKVSGLFVIARNSAFTYKGRAVKVRDVGRELGVRYVLEGSVRKAMNRVRIAAQLIDAATEGHLWAERYDRDLDDIFSLQDEVTQNIVSSLAVRLTEDEKTLRTAKCECTVNPDAYDLYLRALEYLNRFTEKTNQQAREMFREAINLDPAYAQAHAMLAETYLMEWTFGWSLDPRTLEKAWEWSQATLGLDASVPEAHSVMGEIYLWKKEHQLAVSEFQEALSISPNDANIMAGLGSVMTWAGDYEEGLSLINRAIRLNPVPPPYYSWFLGHAYYLLNQHENAVEMFERAFRLNPDWWPSQVFSTICFVEMGRMDDAGASAEKVLEGQPTFSVEYWEPNMPYKNQGDVDRWADGLRRAGLK
jgi:adenylate cyclase